MQVTHFLIALIEKIRIAALRAGPYYCPICQRSYSRFLSMGTPPRPHSRCPGCNSLERHRLLWVSLARLQAQGVLSKGGRLLHIAPEACLAKILRKDFEYVSVDICAPEAQIRTDIGALCFSDQCFDAIICNHVLEHVPDDRRALSELHRVLKQGGWGSIQVPMKGDETQENPAVIDPAERQRLYGQADHVRQYGDDFRARLREAGFDVIELQKKDILDPIELERLSVACEKSVILVRKGGAGNTRHTDGAMTGCHGSIESG